MPSIQLCLIEVCLKKVKKAKKILIIVFILKHTNIFGTLHLLFQVKPQRKAVNVILFTEREEKGMINCQKK